MTYFVIGAGLFGCVVAERLANVHNENVVLVEKRAHIGGNCHADIDKETGIEVHRYGSHIFHTDNREVYEYLKQFTSLSSYRHRVRTMYRGHSYSMPVSLDTLNAFFGCVPEMTPREALAFFGSCREDAGGQAGGNFEQCAIARVGLPLYEALYRGYTKKQWGCSPSEIPAVVAKRLPFRSDYDTEYFDDRWQGIPEIGYAAWFASMTGSQRIEKRLGTAYADIRGEIPSDAVVIYTGMPDELFDYACGELAWRSLDFKFVHLNVGDFQGIAVMNYADECVPHTRIHEFKHYAWKTSPARLCDSTIVCYEYPKAYTRGGEAYYPINDEKNNAIFSRYREKAEQIRIHLGGRLGSYRYLNMDQTIAEALGLVVRMTTGRERV